MSCPTCGRCQIDLIPIADEVARRLRDRRTPIKVAVMGCVVNGPGEARDADIGVAAGQGVGLIFARGETVRKVAEAEIVDALFDEIDRLEASRRVVAVHRADATAIRSDTAVREPARAHPPFGRENDRVP